jgi:hypothetical protein
MSTQSHNLLDGEVPVGSHGDYSKQVMRHNAQVSKRFTVRGDTMYKMVMTVKGDLSSHTRQSSQTAVTCT